MGSNQQRITQHIHYGLTPLPFGTLLPMVATSYMLRTLGEIAKQKGGEHVMSLMRVLSILCFVCFIVLAVIWHPADAYLVWLAGGILAVVAQILNYADDYISRFTLQRKFSQISQDVGSEWLSRCERDFFRSVWQAPIVLVVLVLLMLLAQRLPNIGTPLLPVVTGLFWIMVVLGWLTSSRLRRELDK